MTIVVAAILKTEQEWIPLFSCMAYMVCVDATYWRRNLSKHKGNSKALIELY